MSVTVLLVTLGVESSLQVGKTYIRKQDIREQIAQKAGARRVGYSWS